MISTVPYYCILQCVHIDFNQQGKEMKFQREKNVWQGKITIFYIHLMQLSEILKGVKWQIVEVWLLSIREGTTKDIN